MATGMATETEAEAATEDAAEARERVVAKQRATWERVLVGRERPAFPAPDLTLKERFNELAQMQPDAPYLVYRDEELSYGACNERARRFAAALQRLGCGRGHRVMLCMANAPDLVLLCHACFKLGAIVVCANPLEQRRDLRAKLEDCRPRAVIADERSYPALRDLAEELGTAAPCVRLLASLRVDELPPQPEPVVRLDPDDVQVLQYTGGTTGVMKGCCHTSRGYLASSAAMAQAFVPVLGAFPARTLVALPMGHGSGFTTAVTSPLMAGGSVVLVDALKPSLEDVLAAIERSRPTVWPTVPLVINRYISNEELRRRYDLSSVRIVLTGAAPLARDTILRFEELSHARITEAYGLSEAVNVVTLSPVGRPVAGKVGVPLANTDVLLVDVRTGRVLDEPGAVGEIVVRSPSVMKGYWNDPQRTAEQLRDGWLHTGDLGSFDECGLLQIAGRKKEVIIVSGFNVYPRDVAEALLAHPDVAEAHVVGIPDDERGEVPAALVVRAPGARLTEADLIAFCKRTMTRYKVPRRICFVDALPALGNGKPDGVAMSRWRF